MLLSKICPGSKNRPPIYHESAKSLRPGQSLISFPRHWYCDVFFFFVVNANVDSVSPLIARELYSDLANEMSVW